MKAIGSVVGVVVAIVAVLLLIVISAYGIIELDEVMPDLAEVDITGVSMFESLAPLLFVFGVVVAVLVVIFAAVLDAVSPLIDDLDWA